VSNNIDILPPELVKELLVSLKTINCVQNEENPALDVQTHVLKTITKIIDKNLSAEQIVELSRVKNEISKGENIFHFAAKHYSPLINESISRLLKETSTPLSKDQIIAVLTETDKEGNHFLSYLPEGGAIKMLIFDFDLPKEPFKRMWLTPSKTMGDYYNQSNTNKYLMQGWISGYAQDVHFYGLSAKEVLIEIAPPLVDLKDQPFSHLNSLSEITTFIENFKDLKPSPEEYVSLLKIVFEHQKRLPTENSVFLIHLTENVLAYIDEVIAHPNTTFTNEDKVILQCSESIDQRICPFFVRIGECLKIIADSRDNRLETKRLIKVPSQSKSSHVITLGSTHQQPLTKVSRC
jgi:TnpA family transposase